MITFSDDSFTSNCPDVIIYGGTVSQWVSITRGSFYVSNPISTDTKLYIDGQLLEDAVIEEGVTTIEKYAFYNYAYLKSVTIPSTVVSIGSSAFSVKNNKTFKNAYFADTSGWQAYFRYDEIWKNVPESTLQNSTTAAEALIAFENHSGLPWRKQ